MMGGGSPQTFSSGGNPAPYQPKAQPAMDQLFQQVVGGFPTSPQATPAGQLYPSAVSVFNDLLNPLSGYGSQYQQLATQGAGNAAQMGMAGAPALQGAGLSVLNTAFDPQQQLFQRTLQQVMDQQNVANAMSGLSGTPYGASALGGALQNFDINWQNNLLQRMMQGGQAGTALLNAAPALEASSAALPWNTAGTIGTNALNAMNAVTGLGNAQYILPQQLLNDLESYLQLGQSASNLALRGGDLGFQQTAQGIGGLLSGANTLFGGGGGGGLFGGSGGGLFGGGGSGMSAGAFAPQTQLFSGPISGFDAAAFPTATDFGGAGLGDITASVAGTGADLGGGASLGLSGI